MSKRISKMGTNPLAGINGLIRDTRENTTLFTQQSQEEHNTQAPQTEQYVPEEYSAYDKQYAQNELNTQQEQHTQYFMPRTQGRKGEKLPRINMAFSPERLSYLQAISGFERVSLTHYVNALIEKDMREREELYKTLNELRGN